MSRFIETILVHNGTARNLAYHQIRVNRTISRFFGSRPFELSLYLTNLPRSGSFRCRITYGKTLENLELIPYQQTKKTKLLAIESDLNYNYKFQDRSGLDELGRHAAMRGCDDALIVKNGLIADTTIANIALFDGRIWHTPALPLLQGTMRARLIQSRLIRPAAIGPEDLKRYSHLAIFNALSGFYIAGNPGEIIR